MSWLQSRGARIAAAVFIAAFWLILLAPRHLAKTDEGRYAEIPREMVASGDWITPRLDGLKYFEKPVLQYWSTALAYEAFGLSEWSSRLWTGLCGLLGALCVGYSATRLHGRRIGVSAALVTVSALFYFLMGHIDTLDMGVSAFLTLGICAIIVAESQDDPRRPLLVAWGALACAVLSKGLIGLVLPGAAVVLYTAAGRRLRLLKQAQWVAGPIIFLIIAAPWFILVSRANPPQGESPGFAWFFFVHEHFQRFLTTEHHRAGPWWYFVPILLIGFLPYTGMLPAAVAKAWRMPANPTDARPMRLAVIYSVLVFLFFSASGSKLPSYILPIFPVLSWMVALYWYDARISALRYQTIGVSAVALLGLGACLIAPHVPALSRNRSPADLAFAHWLVIACGLALCGALFAARLLTRERLFAALVALSLGSFLAGTTGLIGYRTLDRETSAKYVADIISPLADESVPIYSVNLYEQSLPFYLRRTVILVDHRDELDYGLTEEPQKGIATLQAFETRWQTDPKAVAIMPPGSLQHLDHLGSYRVVFQDARFLVIAKP